MKKISIVFSTLFFVCLNSFSQSSLGTSGKTMTVEEANKLNGVAQPTINGKPYSQYKAEQDALKQQQNNKKTVLPSDIVIVNAADGKLVPVKNQPVESKPYSGYSKPEPQKMETVVTKTEVKESSVKPAVPEQFKLPANQTWDGKPVADKTAQTSVQTQQPVLPEIKFVQEDHTPKSNAPVINIQGTSADPTINLNQAVPANQPVVNSKEATKPVKATLPAALRGSSMDPDARPVMPVVKAPDAVVPAQNSGNTQPAAEQKQVSKENNSVPSSTLPVKKD